MKRIKKTSSSTHACTHLSNQNEDRYSPVILFITSAGKHLQFLISIFIGTLSLKLCCLFTDFFLQKGDV